MIFWLYNTALVFLAPFWVPWMVWRAAKRKEKPDWRQRCGHPPLQPPAKGTDRVWIHAVSVGEVMAAVPVLRELRAQAPDLEIVLSTTTSSGQTAAREGAANLFDHLVYFPIDVPRFVLASLMRVRPKVVAVMETELWLNFLWTSKQLGVRTILVNGRISDRSYPRSLRVKGYYRTLFRFLDQALVQTATDAERLQTLGFQEPQVVGNTKFDAAAADAADGKDWRAELGIPTNASLVVVGSTRSELEEALVVEALATVPKAWVVHAPRHIERAGAVLEAYRAKLGEAELRSSGRTCQHTVLDTYGELAGIYQAADVVVVGGGFDELGGQNIIQPLAHGKPVLHGPHMNNFRDVAEAAARAGATRVATDAQSLADALQELLADTQARQRMGEAARTLVQRNLGASERCAKAIIESVRA